MSSQSKVVISKITAIFIDANDSKILSVWLDGGTTMSNKYKTEEECRADYEKICQLLEKQ